MSTTNEEKVQRETPNLKDWLDLAKKTFWQTRNTLFIGSANVGEDYTRTAGLSYDLLRSIRKETAYQKKVETSGKTVWEKLTKEKPLPFPDALRRNAYYAARASFNRSGNCSEMGSVAIYHLCQSIMQDSKLKEEIRQGNVTISRVSLLPPYDHVFIQISIKSKTSDGTEIQEKIYLDPWSKMNPSNGKEMVFTESEFLQYRKAMIDNLINSETFFLQELYENHLNSGLEAFLGTITDLLVEDLKPEEEHYLREVMLMLDSIITLRKNNLRADSKKIINELGEKLKEAPDILGELESDEEEDPENPTKRREFLNTAMELLPENIREVERELEDIIRFKKVNLTFLEGTVTPQTLVRESIIRSTDNLETYLSIYQDTYRENAEIRGKTAPEITKVIQEQAKYKKTFEDMGRDINLSALEDKPAGSWYVQGQNKAEMKQDLFTFNVKASDGTVVTIYGIIKNNTFQPAANQEISSIYESPYHFTSENELNLIISQFAESKMEQNALLESKEKHATQETPARGMTFSNIEGERVEESASDEIAREESAKKNAEADRTTSPSPSPLIQSRKPETGGG